jgi:hypothetical protein
VGVTPPRALPTAAVGAALVAATLLPVHRLLDPAVTGLAGAATRAAAEVAWAGDVWGTVLVLMLSLALARFLPVDLLAAGGRSGRRLAGVVGWRFAALCGVIAFVLSLATASVVLGRAPSSVDEMVQLLHARVLLAGRLALPLPAPPAAWVVQNTLLTPSGLASIYPPLHTAMLAVGLAAGAPWLVGPVMTGAAATFVSLSFDRLLAGHRAVARCAALLSASSPFLVFLGGTHLSHTTAGALAAGTLWSALRARDGDAGWALLNGLLVGAFVCTRPWTGIAVSTALLGAVWLPGLRRRPAAPAWLLSRAGATLAGGAPFAALLLAWDGALFGHPLTLGYSAAFGPAHGLGLHVDPWGNAYGLREAFAYTGADLTQLGAVLLESPLPATLVVGTGLLVGSMLPAGSGVLVAWATAGVMANFVYWHHGVHMGPRLLYETGPAWIGLWAVSIPALARAGPGAFGRRAAGWVAALSLGAAPFLAVGRAEAYRPTPEATAAARLPEPETRPALVFVHGSWSSRSAARLVGAGMRRDSVESALRRNDVCEVDAYARWRTGERTGSPPVLDLERLPGLAPGLELRTLSPGNRVPVRPGAPADDACLREARSDRLGTLELEPLLWRAPPLSGDPVVMARDLGPAQNARTAAAFRGYHRYVAVDGGAGAPRILDYRDGMQLLWGGPSPLGN